MPLGYLAHLLCDVSMVGQLLHHNVWRRYSAIEPCEFERICGVAALWAPLRGETAGGAIG
ncbi:MAG: hypothetical protein AAFX40_19040 [Cyanobacteria bacterium J06639_1]